MVIASTASKADPMSTRMEIRSYYEIAKHSHHLQQPQQGSDNEVNTRRIDLATEGLAVYVHRHLTDLSRLSLENALTIVNYVLSQKTEVIEINENTFYGISKEFTWLAQLLYGQQLALELSKRLGTNPDTVRSDQFPYKHARDHLML
jgi:hypothetical protein